MIDENRIFVKYGLKKLQKTKNIGLQALIETAKLKDCQLNSYHLWLYLVEDKRPGRLKTAKEVITLFSTMDRGEATKIAQALEEENKNRKVIQDKITREAINEVNSMNIKDKRTIVLAREGWHPG